MINKKELAETIKKLSPQELATLILEMGFAEPVSGKAFIKELATLLKR